MDPKSSLKLKLKLGNGGSSTPEALSPSQPSEDKMNDDDVDQMISDEEGDGGEDWQEQQGEMYAEDDEGTIPTNSQNTSYEDASRERHKKSKKKKKKKEKEKERHKHKHRERSEQIGEPPTKKLMVSQNEDRSKASGAAFKELLKVLHERLQKKDPQNYFSNPVTDLIAPGYSSIITQPMDFATMLEKIQEGAYTSLSEFREDLSLICNNCMVYNQPDTVFYKAAKRLLHAGEKVLSVNRVLAMKTEFPNMQVLTVEQLGFDIDTEIPEMDVEENSQDSKSSDNENSQDGSNKMSSVQSELSPEEILEQSQQAADEAAEKLTLKKPESTLGFLRQRKDGTTTLNFLTGCEGSDPNLKEKPITLGLLTGKLTQGSTSLHNYRDDKRSMAKPVKPLYYGTFSSFCPTYDSTFANLNKEESEMVYATYGNETAVQYAESICDFSRDCDMAMHLVDQLLNILTHQQHSRTKSFIEEKRRIYQEEQKMQSLLFSSQDESSHLKSSNQEISPNFSTLKTLKDIGIDTTFLNAFEKLEQREKMVSSQLSENATFIASLAKEQKDRLSKPLPANLNHLPQPSPTEIKLAEKVTDGLVSVARQIPPGSLAPVPIVRRALGITMKPLAANDSANDQIEIDIVNTSQDFSIQQKSSGKESKLKNLSPNFQNLPQQSSLPPPHSSGVESMTDRKLKEILESNSSL